MDRRNVMMKSLFAPVGTLCFVFLSLLASCNVGLGGQVDMSGPTLVITSPAYMEVIQEDFVLQGTAVDNVGLRSLELVIDGVGTSGSVWFRDSSGWTFRATADAAPVPVTGATWVQGAGGLVSWSLPVSLDSTVATGEYVITATAKDTAGLTGANAVQVRTVVFDNVDPQFTLNSPSLEVPDAVQSVEDILARFDAYTLEDPVVISKLLNGDISFAWNIEEANGIAELSLRLMGTGDEEVYFVADIDNPVRTGSLVIHAADIIDPATSLKVTDKTNLQLVVDLADEAGNRVEHASKGWFCYWPDADIPWTNLPVGAGDPEDSPVQPVYALTGQAFDDDGLSEITISLYEYGTSTLVGTPLVIDLAEHNEPKSKTWSFTVPAESGNYTMQVVCVDTNGTASVAKTGHFFVQDLSAPRLELNSPNPDVPLFGSAAGSFTVSGTASDDSGIVSVSIAWIKPGASQSEEQLKYLDRNYTGWSSPGTDVAGNKVWVATLGDATVLDGRISRTFSKELSLFDDLGIDGSTLYLGNQLFVLRVLDTNDKASTLLLATTGDSLAPNISIDTVTVVSGATTTPYTINESLILPAFSATDTVSLSGTWSDDSTDVWSDKTKVGALSVSWGSFACTVSRNVDGSWSTADFTPPFGALAAIEASISDFAANRGSTRASFLVETDNPVLARISSDMDDGAYNSGAIDVYLDFNKAVTFSSGSANPSLTLSNGRTATYVSGNGSARHLFRWTVTPGYDTADLGVSAIVANGHSWRDSAAQAVEMDLPIWVNSLAGGKNLVIDTTAPTLESYSTPTAAGSYKAGKEILIQATFSEAVVFNTDSGSPSLELSSGAGVYANYTARLGDTRYLFTYTVGVDDTAATALVVDSFDLNGASIADAAGNSFTSSGGGALDRTILVDTTVPVAPTVSGITTGTKYVVQSFTVAGEAGALVEYSIDDGGNWQTYVSAVSISANGTYTVLARQTDLAGNQSPVSSAIGFTLDAGELLSSLSTTTTDGRYGTGTVIDITLNFRKEVTVGGTPALTLNTSPLRQAVYTGTGAAAISQVFRYTVQEGDSATAFDVTALETMEVTFSDADGTGVNAYVNLPAAGNGKTLAEQRLIDIVTGIPVLQSATLSGSTLTLAFSGVVYKGAGDIVLSIADADYRIPAVLAEARYNELYGRLGGADQSAFAAAYTLGTNGATAEGSPDLDAKYVLDWTTDLDDAALVSILKTALDHQLTIPVLSSTVVRSADGLSLGIELSGSFALPVKGVTYGISVPAGLVVDGMSVGNPLNNTETVASTGVEEPVIRIQKSREVLAPDGGAVVRATQPLTAQLRMDCRTPGATIRYTSSDSTHAAEPIANTIVEVPHNTGAKPVAQPALALPAEPDGTSLEYATPLTLGSNVDLENGYRYRFRARATAGGVWSLDAHEIAYRSVLSFDPNGVAIERGAGDGYSDDLTEQPWVRGGDSVGSTVLTPGFPISWETSEYDKVRLMTQETVNRWYWVSWEVYTTAYVGLVLGSTPTDATNATLYGPKIWGWNKNEWVPFKEYYPLFPGESRHLQADIYDNGYTLGPTTLGRGPFNFATTAEGGTEDRLDNP